MSGGWGASGSVVLPGPLGCCWAESRLLAAEGSLFSKEAGERWPSTLCCQGFQQEKWV